MKQIIVLNILILIKLTELPATSFYLSSAGSDAAAGTSPATAWKTITHLNSQIAGFSPGDKILFRRGDVFEGQIDVPVSGTLAARIVFDAYGAGADPIISGAVQPATWSVVGGNIWKTTVTDGRVRQLFEGDRRLTHARFPNTGYLRMDGGNSATGFTDAALTQPSNYFSGCTLVCATTDYTWEYPVVTSSTSGGVITHAATTNLTAADVGYYFTGKQAFLDMANEWFFDTLTNELFLYAASDPTGRDLWASVYDYGIKGTWNKEYISIRNIDFKKQNNDGVWLFGAPCKFNSIIGCDFKGQLLSGITMMGDSLQIINCSFSDVAGIGILGSQIYRMVVKDNSFLRIGIQPGLANGAPEAIGLQAIRLWSGNQVLIQRNSIDSTGYNGISTIVDNAVIEMNHVSHALLETADGGGLYAYNNASHTSVYRYNLVENLVGNISARPAGTEKIVHAIYMDNYVHDVLIHDNTVREIEGSGICINAGAHDIEVRKNHVYKVHSGLIMPDWLGGASIYGNIIKGNKFYANRVGFSAPMRLQSNDNNYGMIASSDSNYLCQPFDVEVVRYEWSVTDSFSLNQWRTLSGWDMKSTGSYYNWTFPTDSSFMLVNFSPVAVTYSLWSSVDLDNNPVGTVTLTPYSSDIFIGKGLSLTGSGSITPEIKLAVIYPQPVMDEFRWKNIDPSVTHYRILDITGKTIQEGLVSERMGIVYCSPGLYQVLALDIHGKILGSAKMIVGGRQ